MKGKVVGTTVVVDELLPEGTAVDVVVHDAADSTDFVITDEQRRELRAASEAMKRGESVEMSDVLDELERR